MFGTLPNIESNHKTPQGGIHMKYNFHFQASTMGQLEMLGIADLTHLLPGIQKCHGSRDTQCTYGGGV